MSDSDQPRVEEIANSEADEDCVVVETERMRKMNESQEDFLKKAAVSVAEQESDLGSLCWV